jgi:DNA-binding IclR family transcriptional regulator
MTPPRKHALNHNALRMLAYLMTSPWPVSKRELATHCGMYINGAVRHLNRLRRLGLVTFEKKKFATVRPTCKFVKASDL